MEKTTYRKVIGKHVPQITVRFPTKAEDERTIRFQVHHYYLAGICNYLFETYKSTGSNLVRDLVHEQRSLRSFKKISRRRHVDLKKLSQYLTLTWASELQLRLALLNEPSLLRYSNAWAPVHAYYAVYMSAQAWFISMGSEEIADNHPASLHMLANQIKDRELFPRPWSVFCQGCPPIELPTFDRIPAGVDPHSHIELLSRPSLDNFWQRYGKMLQTTRDRRLKRNFEEWKRQNHKKKMFRHQKLAVSKKLPPTTIFDFFWRLRVRSNYRDVRAFIMSPVDTDWHEEFLNNLMCITEASCTLLQSLVAAYAGRDAYKKAIDEFIVSQNKICITEILDPFINRAWLLAYPQATPIRESTKE